MEIDNILIIIEKSLFDFEQVNNILCFIDENKLVQKNDIAKLKNLTKIGNRIVKPLSEECNNCTFCIFQLLKFYLIWENKSFQPVQENLFHFFDKVFSFEATDKKESNTHKEMFCLRKMNAKNIDHDWHLVNFNVYYIFKLHIMYRNKYKISIKDYQQLDKYFIHKGVEGLKRSIGFCIHQYRIFEKHCDFNCNFNIYKNIIFYILNYIVKKIQQIDNNICIKISYDEYSELQGGKQLLNEIQRDARKLLEDLNDDKISQQLLKL